MTTEDDVIVIGAGIAGLCCGLELKRRGIPFRILEASDGVGGRVRTDLVEGYRLDRGFQVLLTAYPEARAVLDYPSLDLKPFFNGCYIQRKDRRIRFGDPFRNLSEAWSSLTAPVGTLRDRWRILKLRGWLKAWDAAELAREMAPEDTLAELEGRGFSKGIIDNFFKPFFGGVFLEQELKTSKSFFWFAFKMFSEGEVSVPAKGIGAIADQLADQLPEGCLQFNTRVQSVANGGYTLAGGEQRDARAVIIATDGASAAHLLGRDRLPHQTVTNMYFSAESSPLPEHPPGILLCPEVEWINNLHVVSDIAPECAPEGKALISVSVVRSEDLSNAELAEKVRGELHALFGPEVAHWQLLRVYRIEGALPKASASEAQILVQAATEKGAYLCGDYLGVPSLQEAMRRGREAGESVSARLQP